MATARTSRRKGSRLPGSRAQITLALLLFVAVLATVAWRRAVGVSTDRRMRAMQKELRALRGEQVTLATQLGRARSWQSVVTAAERRLGMHVASEAQARDLTDPSRTP
jgi:uncharacterized protein Veg